MQRNQFIRPLNSMLKKIFNPLLELTGVTSGLLYMLIIFALCWEVVARRIFNSPTIWALDLSTLSLYVSSLIAMGWVLKHEGHIKIDLVLSLLNPRKQAVMNVITSFLGFITCAVVTWQGFDAVYNAYKDNLILVRALEVPKFLYMWAYPFGFLLLTIQFALRIEDFIRKMKSE